MQNILITGAGGFMGKNLVATLRQTRKDLNLLLFDVQNTPDDLHAYVTAADFVFHLAGVNRPHCLEEFTTGNVGLTEQLIALLEEHHHESGRSVPLMVSSSIQAELENPYGQSKRQAEALVFEYGARTGAPVYVYRFPNVFGKWCRPNYNSAVATFCHNIAHDLPITVNDPSVVMKLVYIDDVVAELLRALDGEPTRGGSSLAEPGGLTGQGGLTEKGDTFCAVPVVHTVTLGEIADTICSFRASRSDRSIPDMGDPFTKKLYSTYLSYLPEDQFSYPLKMNVDTRGSFTEFLRTPERGQVSVNISKPGIVKGNHWHHSKNEKFLVVQGQGVIRFRRIDSEKVIEYRVSGEKLEVVDIPTGYTHNIENVGEGDMVTIMWANEAFDVEKPDTFTETV